MAASATGAPERGPWRRSRRCRLDPIRTVREILRRIESNGPCELYRAQLVLALRRLLSSDWWDGPLAAA